MPPTPKTKGKAAPRPSSIRSPIDDGATASSKAGTGSAPAKPTSGRKTNDQLLQEKIERFYMMIGTVIMPFHRWYPPLEGIGNGMKTFADEASSAWMELAKENNEVKQMLERWTSASVYGNLIGVHFAMFMTAIPMEKIGSIIPPEAQGDPISFARSMGLSDEEIAQALRMAEGAVSDRKPEPSIDELRRNFDQDEGNLSRVNTGPGIVTPEELGVTRGGQDKSTPMPADPSPPNGA
jgi:hypothetical protein